MLIYLFCSSATVFTGIYSVKIAELSIYKAELYQWNNWQMLNECEFYQIDLLSHKFIIMNCIYDNSTDFKLNGF